MIPREILKTIRRRTNCIVQSVFLPCLALSLGVVWCGCSSTDRNSANPETKRGQSADGLRLSVYLDKNSYVVGEEITATVQFWNVNKLQIFAPTEIPRFDTEIIVADESGQRLEPKKPPGWDRMSDFEKRVVKTVKQARFKTLPRGAKENYHVNLNDVFDFANPGVYQIEVVYHSAQNGSATTDTYSKKASFAVIPASTPR